jgi:hypothetical protein
VNVPRAFDEPTETTPGADETVEIQEGIRDETQSASNIEGEDPSEQLQGELVSGILGARDLMSDVQDVRRISDSCLPGSDTTEDCHIQRREVGLDEREQLESSIQDLPRDTRLLECCGIYI